MLSKRTIVGFIVGGIIIGLAGYSLLEKLGPTITVTEDFVMKPGETNSFTIIAPNNAAQHMVISGDSFDLELKSPGDGLQIPNKPHTGEIVLDWVHLIDGESKIKIHNTGNTELKINSVTEQTPNPIGFTFDIMVITSGLVIIGFSMGFTLRKPKGF